ncbi:hypothetical protein GUITHDRAFT_101549 [Guillardia theta CCMP2712]|uniref:FHA domain-containing protein n=1 Tax=Guillardia theta (strain CCMP2712) TaxID=905079 RepID=L1JXN8_GUITC|nr:hypothetical protein GUITHDRAFT_101549 [Guillardia theta CCMP2712]EKX53109.1 hypothetical protein GUITHDRAFT_101549 [Guillardia theta CCMP2712]|eukprot:XP_005840089.1 hypothetical protein GUITHDRAFT_101549 [Guillardia theta CCMP2712]
MQGSEDTTKKRKRQVYQGYLHKHGSTGENPSSRKRWFVLRRALFLCYKGSAATKPRLILDVGGGKADFEEDDKGSRLRLVSSNGRSLLLSAACEAVPPSWDFLVWSSSSSQDAKLWFDAFQSAFALRQVALLMGSDVHDMFSVDRRSTMAEGVADQAPSNSVHNPRGLPVLLVLEMIEGPCKGERFEIPTEGVTVIRKPSGISALHHKVLKELQLPDQDVSRKHAEIRCEGGVYSIKDLGSLNGTVLNGTRLSPEKVASDWKVLSGGDKLIIGKCEISVFFRVKVPDDPLSFEEIEKRRRRAERRLKYSWRMCWG